MQAVHFLRWLNREVYDKFPDVQMFAEESTAWPMVSRPTYLGGLGFGLKWDMGWMHDTLLYFSKDPVHRAYHQNDLTFRMIYAFTENFILALSHDEVVHGKGSLLSKMPGDDWQKFSNLRLLYGYMTAQPGKKLTFMGNEFGQWDEWQHERSLDWHLLEYPAHARLQRWLRDLNFTYRAEPALYDQDFAPQGFDWIDCRDSQQSVLAFRRADRSGDEQIVAVCNFTPVPRFGYRIGVDFPGMWKEILNSDALEYGGSGSGNLGGTQAQNVPAHGRPYSLNLCLPPLGILFLKGWRPR